MKNILLLTSTIYPNPKQPQLRLTNPLDRLEDYRKALEFYTNALNESVIDRIIFVDNSGFDLKCLSENFSSNNIEWISYFGLDYPSTYHRGYGEFQLVDYAFANSYTLKDLDNRDIVWKVTGRYIIKNLKSVIRYAPRQFALYCDIKNNWVNMALMAWNVEGYKLFIKGVSENFKSDMPPELIMAKLIKEQSKSRKGVVTDYYWTPLIIARRGFDGVSFQGRFTYLKFILISCFKLLRLPFRNAEYTK
jgi:hypothetical protein